MAIFELGGDYTASFIPYRHGSGYTAKGTVFRRGKPVRVFEARGATIPIAAAAARAKAEEICRQLKAEKRKRAAKKR